MVKHSVGASCSTSNAMLIIENIQILSLDTSLPNIPLQLLNSFTKYATISPIVTPTKQAISFLRYTHLILLSCK